MLFIEGIFLVAICGNRFSDEREVAVFDAFDEDFLFKDFGISFDYFDLVRWQKVDRAVEVIYFDYLAIGELGAIRWDSGPISGSFFGSNLGQKAGIAIDNKESAVFTINAGGAVCGPLEWVFGVAAGKERYSDVEGDEVPGYLLITNSVFSYVKVYSNFYLFLR